MHKLMIVTLFCGLALGLEPVYAGADPPLVKEIDLRAKEEPSPLYVVFCSRWDTLPGHAFVVLGKEDAQAMMSTVDAFGYYPETSGNTKAVLKRVPGVLADEFVRGTLAPTLVRLILKVNKADFDAVKAVRDLWESKGSYKLIERDCVTFVMDVASALGLTVPNRSGFDNIPWNYVRKLAEANSQEQHLDGFWESNDPGHRFRLEITRRSCVWIERAASGTTLSRQGTVSGSAAGFRVERPNDADVLTFLGFQPTLRGEILAAEARPSFLVLVRSGNSLSGSWNGLAAIKDAQAHLKELKQPGTTPAKLYTFNRVF